MSTTRRIIIALALTAAAVAGPAAIIGWDGAPAKHGNVQAAPKPIIGWDGSAKRIIGWDG